MAILGYCAKQEKVAKVPFHVMWPILYCFHYNILSYATYYSFLKLVVNSSDSDRGTLRLINGSSTAGRLQMQLDGVWTQVCSDGFSAGAANVACSQLLGLGSIGTVHTDGR